MIQDKSDLQRAIDKIYGESETIEIIVDDFTYENGSYKAEMTVRTWFKVSYYPFGDYTEKTLVLTDTVDEDEIENSVMTQIEGEI